MIIDLMIMASAGLNSLAISGSPNLLKTELENAGHTATIITRNDFSAAAGGFTPTSDLFITCPGGRREYLAPRGLELADGTKWAMFEPFCYPDHFIIEYPGGRLERWDVGARPSGGQGETGVPYMVEVVNGKIVRSDDNDNGGGTPRCDTGDKTRYDESTNSCVCPQGKIEDPTDEDSCITPPPGCATSEATLEEKMMCAEMLPQDATYDSSDCTRNDHWEVEYEVDGNNNIRENCLIPMEVSATSPATASSGSPRPLQINLGNIKGCEMRKMPGFTLGTLADLPECENDRLFGDGGLPARPDGFNAETQRLTVVPAASGRARVYFNNNEITPGISSGGGGGGSSAGLIIGGIAVAGFLAYSLTGGTPEEISWAPQYSVFHNGGGTYYSYGSRWSYQKSGWSAYWETGKAGAGEEWRYGSGVEWTGDVWTASFSGVNIGDESDLDVSLSARKKIRGNAWTLRAGANTDIMADEYGAEFSHRLSAGADYRGGLWTVDFSAGASGDGFQHANAFLNLKRDL